MLMASLHRAHLQPSALTTTRTFHAHIATPIMDLPRDLPRDLLSSLTATHQGHTDIWADGQGGAVSARDVQVFISGVCGLGHVARALPAGCRGQAVLPLGGTVPLAPLQALPE